MKLTIRRDAFLEAIDFASSIVPKRTPKPVLACVSLVAKDKRLSVVATDMEISMRRNIKEVDITEEGEVLIPAERLLLVVKSLNDDTLNIEAKDDVADIRTGSGKFRLYGYPHAGFPPTHPYEPAEMDLKISGDDLGRMIGRTDFAAAKEPTRYALQGLLFESTDKAFTIVATNGSVLSLVTSPIAGNNIAYVIPLEAAALIRSLIDFKGAQVRIQHQADNVGRVCAAVFEEGFDEPLATLIASLVEGTFPPYADIIQKESSRTAKIQRAAFERGIRQAATFGTEESKGIRLSFTKGALAISCRAPSIGDAAIDVPCEFVGEPIEIGFNPDYLLSYLRTVEADTVTIELTTPNKPAKFTADPGAVYVCMPANLS